MKKLLFIAICFISLQVSAQGNLQFNQVGSISVSGNMTAFSSFTQGFTVPAGKVWKIELGSFITVTSGLKRPNTVGYVSLFIDGYWIQGNFGSELESNTLPLWIEEGAHILEIVNASGANYG